MIDDDLPVPREEGISTRQLGGLILIAALILALVRALRGRRARDR